MRLTKKEQTTIDVGLRFLQHYLVTPIENRIPYLDEHELLTEDEIHELRKKLEIAGFIDRDLKEIHKTLYREK